jgi:hypothetical protein
MAEEPENDLLPVDPKGEWAEAIAFMADIIPVLGSPIANVLNGWSQERRQARVKEVLQDLSARLRALGGRLDEGYVRSDEFEDLLDRTLRQVTSERSQAKRRLYAAFLAGAIENPGEPYHEQLRMLRTIDELQPDHIRIMRAMLQAPESGRYSSGTSSTGRILMRRLPEIPEDRLMELAMQTTEELHVTTIGKNLRSMATVQGAEDLRDLFTPYGRRLLAYIQAADQEAEPK